MENKTRIISKFHRTDFVIYSHSREKTTTSYSRINTVFILKKLLNEKAGY